MFVSALSHDLDIKRGGLESHVCDCLKSQSKYQERRLGISCLCLS